MRGALSLSRQPNTVWAISLVGPSTITDNYLIIRGVCIVGGKALVGTTITLKVRSLPRQSHVTAEADPGLERWGFVRLVLVER